MALATEDVTAPGRIQYARSVCATDPNLASAFLVVALLLALLLALILPNWVMAGTWV